MRIKFFDHEGKLFTDFEIPECFHLAMKANAKAKGISLKHWVENAMLAKVARMAAKSPPKRSPNFTPADCNNGSVQIDGNCDYLLTIFGQHEDASLACVRITSKQFQAMQLVARKAGKSLGELLCHACECMLQPETPARTFAVREVAA